MATLKPVIVPAKALSDGRHKIRVALSHNGETRYIVTDIVLESPRQFSGGQITRRPDSVILNTKLRRLVMSYQQIIDETPYVDGLGCTQLVEIIKNGGAHKRMTLEELLEDYQVFNDIKPRTLETYQAHLRAAVGFLGSGYVIDCLSRPSVIAYDRHLRSKRLKPATVGMRLMFLRTLYNHAVKCGYLSPRVDPFGNYTFPRGEISQTWLTVEQVRAIRDYDTKVNGIARARDIFMLSYYLGGINMTDLMDLDLTASVVRYERKKTDRRAKVNKFVEFTMPDVARELAARWVDDSGRLMMTKNQRAKAADGLFRYRLPQIGKDLGIPRLVFYSARKSFAQHAFDLGVGESVIEYVLGHSLGKSGSSLFHYISVTPAMATEAINKVLRNLG